MLSYHNDAAVKEKFILRFAAHRAADEVVQGTGFDNGRGCFVGCTLDKYEHSCFENELGWPEWLARLADKIFEGIPISEAPQFGTDLLASVPVGVDLEPVRFSIAIARHNRQILRLEGNSEPYAQECRTALASVIAYCEGMLSGSQSARSAARSAAWSAAAAAAWSAAAAAACSAESAAQSAAAWSAAESAAWSAQSAAESAAWSARSAAESAAWSAAWSAAAAAARCDEYQIERDELLSVICSMDKKP